VSVIFLVVIDVVVMNLVAVTIVIAIVIVVAVDEVIVGVPEKTTTFVPTNQRLKLPNYFYII